MPGGGQTRLPSREEALPGRAEQIVVSGIGRHADSAWMGCETRPNQGWVGDGVPWEEAGVGNGWRCPSRSAL